MIIIVHYYVSLLFFNSSTLSQNVCENKLGFMSLGQLTTHQNFYNFSPDDTYGDWKNGQNFKIEPANKENEVN